MTLRLGLAAALLLLAVLGACGSQPLPSGSPDLGRLRVVAHIADVAGYDRSCSTKGQHACSFGPSWTDATDVALGRNSCDTRNDILKRDLRNATLKPGSRGCVVLSGSLTDPYTGRVVEYRRGASPQAVQVDHVLGLHASWDRGAAAWPPQRRIDLANDPRNLLTTSAAVNESKGDRTPQDWRPPARSGWCTYARHFSDVALAYDLAVTPADVRALRKMLRTC